MFPGLLYFPSNVSLKQRDKALFTCECEVLMSRRQKAEDITLLSPATGRYSLSTN